MNREVWLENLTEEVEEGGGVFILSISGGGGLRSICICRFENVWEYICRVMSHTVSEQAATHLGGCSRKSALRVPTGSDRRATSVCTRRIFRLPDHPNKWSTD